MLPLCCQFLPSPSAPRSCWCVYTSCSFDFSRVADKRNRVLCSFMDLASLSSQRLILVHVAACVKALSLFIAKQRSTFGVWTGFYASKDPWRWLALPSWVIHPSMCKWPRFRGRGDLSSGGRSPRLSWNELMWRKVVPGWEAEKVLSSCLALRVASRRYSDEIRLKGFTEGWSTNLFPEKAEIVLAVKSVKGVCGTFSQMKMDTTIKTKQQSKHSQVYSSGVSKG